jgi:hypothetical protein
MFYPHPFGHPIEYPFPPYSTGHYPMPTSQQNQVQSMIVKDIKQENWEDAKNGSYRNCLVCGDNNFACGWFKYRKATIKLIFYSGSFSGKYTGTGLQVCYCCKVSNFISLKN